MKYAVIMIPLLLLSGGPACAEWVAISTFKSSGGDTMYVDPDTIRRKGNLVKMWTLNDFHSIQPNEARKRFLSYKTQIEYDCEEERGRTLAFTFFSGNMGTGEVLVTDSDADKWTPVEPRSTDEVLSRLACSKQ